MGGSKVRALLGGAVVIALVALVAGEIGAGPAGANQEGSTKAELALPHGERPAAARPSRFLEVTPLTLAANLAADNVRAVAAQRDALVQYVAAVKKAQAEAAYAYAVAVQQAAQTAALAQARAARSAQVRSARVSRAPTPAGASGVPTDGAYGGTLACIRAHESDTAGGYSAYNRSSGAAGAYQVLPSTWNGFGGYASAAQAPPAVQDAWARSAISQVGTRPWAGSGC
jgi:hypothetical protein